jgi:hypothetical protein
MAPSHTFFIKQLRLLFQCVAVLLLCAASPRLSAQVAGNAVTLKGTDYIRTTLWSSDIFVNNRNFTYEFWFNATGPGVLVGETDTIDPTQWDVAFAEIFPGGVIKAGAKDLPTITVGTVPFNTWNHLAVIYNSANQTLYAYLNGVLTGTSTGTHRIPSDSQRQSVYVFGRGGPSNLGGGNWFSGKFDEVRIWNIAIDANQVTNNWNRVLASSPAGLVALWHFDTVNGNFSPDSRPGGNNQAWYVPDSQTMPLVASTAPLLPPPPNIATKAAAVTDNSAQLQGTVNPQGVNASVYFEWGSTGSYGNSTTTNSVGNGTSDVNFSATLSNLAPGTYHYRAVAISGSQTIQGADTTFAILGAVATTGTPTITGNSVQLAGSANPHKLATSAFFEWGTTTQYGNATDPKAVGSGNVDVIFGETLLNLEPGTYHFRAVATYDGGRSNGSDATFIIQGPSAVTQTAIVTGNSAKLRGVANAQGISASAFFQWGATTQYGSETPLQPIGSGGANINVFDTLNNLAPGIYHFRAAISNATSKFFGPDATFTIASSALGAAKLSGNDYIRTTLWSDAIFTNEDFTFELWFNASSPGVLINETDTVSAAAWDYAFAEIFPGGTIRVGVPGVTEFEVGAISFGTWHHLAIVYSGASKILAAYLDGAPAGSSFGDRATPKEANRTSVYTVGRGGPTNLGGGNWLSGLIDEVRIWRRPLTATEIATQFDKILSLTDASLMANWHLDELNPNPNTPYLSPDASGKNNYAWHVPQTTFTLVDSTVPAGPDLRPIIVINNAGAVTPSTIEVRASVNPQGADTVAYFEFGRSNVFQRGIIQKIGSGNALVPITDAFAGLEFLSAYQYHLVASNSFGVTTSPDFSVSQTRWAGYDYALIPNNYLRTTANQNPLFIDKSITVELWFYPTKAGVLAAETSFSSAYDRSILEILPPGGIQGGFNGLQPISLGDALFNRWNHVALRYNAATQLLDGFLNGVKGQSRTGPRTTPADVGIQGQFAFGKGTITRLGTGENWGGKFDEIRVWNLARSDEDLTTARFNLLAGDESGLVLNWRGNATASEPISDLSPHANVGQNVGAATEISTAPLIYNIRKNSPTEVETQFVVKGGSTYRLESSSDLVHWAPVSTNTAAASGFVRLPEPISQSSGPVFYRVMPQ